MRCWEITDRTLDMRSGVICGTRQVEEAIAILPSPDTLLNSKNESNQNCISRITVEEDKLARKRRLMEEEAEKKEHEEKVKEFKKIKRPAKRKTGDGPEGWKTPKTRKVEETPTGSDLGPPGWKTRSS